MPHCNYSYLTRLYFQLWDMTTNSAVQNSPFSYSQNLFVSVCSAPAHTTCPHEGGLVFIYWFVVVSQKIKRCLEISRLNGASWHKGTNCSVCLTHWDHSLSFSYWKGRHEKYMVVAWKRWTNKTNRIFSEENVSAIMMLGRFVWVLARCYAVAEVF